MSKDTLKRIRAIKLKSGDELLANVVLCGADFKLSPFGKSKIVDPYTGVECVLVSYPVRYINQLSLNDVVVSTYTIQWIAQSADSLFYIPIETIINISIPSEAAINQFKAYFKGLMESTKVEEPKVVSPPHHGIH